MATVIRGSDNFDTAYAKSVAIIADVKAQNVSGGSSLGGDWNNRNLNTEIDDPEDIVSISSNQFTLQAGTYLIEWACPAYRADRHQTRLWNVTASALVDVGTTAYAYSLSGVEDSNTSTGAVIQTISSATAFKLQHYTQTAKATNGLGVNAHSGSSTNSVYTIVKIHKIGA